MFFEIWKKNIKKRILEHCFVEELKHVEIPNQIQIHWTALYWLKQLIPPKLNSLIYFASDVRTFTFVLSRVLAKWYLQF